MIYDRTEIENNKEKAVEFNFYIKRLLNHYEFY